MSFLLSRLHLVALSERLNSHALHDDVAPLPSLAVLADLGKDWPEMLNTDQRSRFTREALTGWPWSRDSSKAATQQSISRVLESFRSSRYRLCHSMMATSRGSPEPSRCRYIGGTHPNLPLSKGRRESA